MTIHPGPGERFGRYRVVRLLGRGGMGAVYEARQDDLDRSVALKILAPELGDDTDFRRRFEREARALASLDSPHVIQVYEYGEHDGQLYIATQLINGPDLYTLVHQRGALEPAVALEVLAQLASGLADAHGVGLVHRDVKPSNVLVRETRGDPFAYLCDFGIARSSIAEHTRTNGVVGTLAYMAPEVHHGHDATAASDLYSLGCVLWEVLTGVLPFQTSSIGALVLAHVSQPAPSYAGPGPAVREIDAIIQRCMAKEPADRYASADELRRALLQAADVARGRTTVDGSLPLPGGATVLSPHAPVPDPTAPVPPVPTGGGYGPPPTPGQPPVSDEPSPTRADPPSPATGAPEPRSKRRWPVLVAVAAVLVVLAGVPGALWLTGRDDPAPSGAAAPVPDAGATSPASMMSDPSSPTDPAPSTEPTPTQEPTSAAPDPVVCWDGSTAADAGACGWPKGLAGVRTVFPSLDSTCVANPDVSVPAKAEVWTCQYDGYLVRYSRWDAGTDVAAYLDNANAGFTGGNWRIDGTRAGRTWTSEAAGASADRRYQWSAAYLHAPYSVSVEASSPSGRARGIGAVRAVAPDLVGLRP